MQSFAKILQGQFVFALATLTACAPQLDAPTPAAGTADFSRVVVLGGSELAGYQDGALYAEGQRNSVGNLIVRQLALVKGEGAMEGEFVPATLPEGVSMGLNKPWVSRYQTQSRLGDRVDCEGTVSLGPVKDTISEASLEAAGAWNLVPATSGDFAIPFMTLGQLRNRLMGQDRSLGGAHAYAARYFHPANNISVLEAAGSQQPTFFIAWPGMQDIHNWAANGGESDPLPDANLFDAQVYDLVADLCNSGARGVLATIPDIRYFPYFTTIPPRGLELAQSTADSLNNIYALGGASVNFTAGENGFVVGDPTTSQGFRQLEADEYITLNVPLDSMRCYYMGVLFRLMPDRYTLIRFELDYLRSLIAAYNQKIREQAAFFGLPVVDMDAVYARLEAGMRFDGVDFGVEFVSGGFFSLDGYWPNPKGAGILANAFIEEINAHYGATVPPVQLHGLRGVLFP